MFRNIVSRLSFSPALVEQLGFYAKRLKKEQVTRRLGLIFTALALVVQSLAVFQAPEPANAASDNDFVYGGLGSGSNVSLNNFLNPYDKNTKYLRDIMNSFGITRAEIAAAKYGKFYTSAEKVSWGRNPRTVDIGKLNVYNNDWQQVTTVYGRDMKKLYNNREATIYGYIGYSQKVGWFAVMQACGNLVTQKVPPSPTPPKDIKVCDLTTYKIITIREDIFNASKHTKNLENCDSITVCDLTTFNTITIKAGQFNPVKHSKNLEACDSVTVCDLTTFNRITIREGQFDETKYSRNFNDCEPTKVCRLEDKAIVFIKEGEFDSSKYSRDEEDCGELVLTKTASNTTQGNVDATTIRAQASDRITYTLTVENTGTGAISADFVDQIDDVIEYATVIDTGGAAYDKSKQTLSWPTVTLAGGAKETRTYTVKLLGTIPSAPTGHSDPTSYDCQIDNVFGSGVAIPVQCETPKVVEEIVTQLPHTGPTENMVFAAIALAVVTFFYYRSKQMNKEIRLVRRNLNRGTL